MTARRTLGSGPERFAPIGAAQADLLDDLPGVRLPDLAELRARGVLGARTARPPAARRVLGAGRHPDTDPSDSSG
ncbi:hypothetical protein ACFVZC_35515 [Streptomyces marokkonensis]|uniref:Uncharacterized protein n=1 Tax=Streptomyces marokkonensis TaxID=324855 RepID=A0ABW6QHC0_9ACTN